ncbi:hypothetical protein [Methanobrevibacter sp.]|uniref:hypothetical protein n=1 Tax=Methanobrevibacter sp. TaxID=66852 RepID=UPI0025ED7E3C|nr:hypothetical protein [Methanobrevibacter sp.]MBQ6512075.1 hypothetical protein [Methanobrevibacter sp.]
MSDNGELVAVEETTAPTLHGFDMVDVDGAAAFMDNYQELVKALLDDEEDYQGGKKKKSAWRKLATAFNISDCVVEKEIIREDNYQIISAFFMVKCTLPNGRSCIGVGDASIFDKIRYSSTKKHEADKETPSNFELRGRFTNAEHDVIATAHTRAKSRAIADLIGAGEVSAEELGEIPKKVSRTSRNNSNSNESSENADSKPATGKRTRRSKRKTKKAEEEEVIEAKAEVVSEPSKSPNLKSIAENNPAIKQAINRIQDAGETVTKAGVIDELFRMFDLGKLSLDEYDEAKGLLMK